MPLLGSEDALLCSESPETFCETFFFGFAWGLALMNGGGIFGEFFLVSVSWQTKHEQSSKTSGKIRDDNFGRQFEKLGTLSFCNFSDL